MSLFVDEPFRATFNNGSEGEQPCLLLGVISVREAIICRADGQIEVLNVAHVRLTWRYDQESDGWVDDAAVGPPPQFGITDQSSNGLGAQIGEEDGASLDVQEPVQRIDQPPRRRSRS